MNFAACLNCMDGRYQLPVINWIRDNYAVEYVDMITQPGMDGLLANPEFKLDPLLRLIDVSLVKHKAEMIFVVGHHDCAGNPVDDPVHRRQVLTGVDRIKAARPQAKVIGLFAPNQFMIEKIGEK